MEKGYHVITRKVQLSVVGDKQELNRVYQFIRNSQYAQNRAYNILISHVYTAIYSGQPQECINDLYKRGSRNPKENEPDYSLYPFGEFEFGTGLGTPAVLSMAVKNDIALARTRGLFKGKIALSNKKMDAPLAIAKHFSFFHNYDSHEQFLDALNSDKVELYMKFVNGIVFKVVFGNPYKSRELRSIFKNIMEDNYTVNGSSIQFDKTGRKIILNLTLTIPEKELSLDENTVIGVKLGMYTPIVCSVNNSSTVKKFGNSADILATKMKIQGETRRLQASLKYTGGGHGRKKKLAPLKRMELYERNVAKNYNHQLSRDVVNFALEHNAKYINLEEVDSSNLDQYVLRNWTYCQQQQYIRYKAAQHGIIVQIVKSPKTCICESCGQEMSEVVPGIYVCQDFDCDAYNKEIDRDYNYSKQIAVSTEFV